MTGYQLNKRMEYVAFVATKSCTNPCAHYPPYSINNRGHDQKRIQTHSSWRSWLCNWAEGYECQCHTTVTKWTIIALLYTRMILKISDQAMTTGYLGCIRDWWWIQFWECKVIYSSVLNKVALAFIYSSAFKSITKKTQLHWPSIKYSMHEKIMAKKIRALIRLSQYQGGPKITLRNSSIIALCILKNAFLKCQNKNENQINDHK
jgi:hypothetical protein